MDGHVLWLYVFLSKLLNLAANYLSCLQKIAWLISSVQNCCVHFELLRDYRCIVYSSPFQSPAKKSDNILPVVHVCNGTDKLELKAVTKKKKDSFSRGSNLYHEIILCLNFIVSLCKWYVSSEVIKILQFYEKACWIIIQCD